ncbi:MAG: glycosyltransferase family 4 protein [Paludibacteraceae bacterium]|nr:glycosyltransferase family 4 protein [Paludibacteraceae bacterium]
MKILIVCSVNKGWVVPFISEQAESLENNGHTVEWLKIDSNGWKGYWNKRKELKEKIKSFNPDIIHAHYGLCGLLANFQRKVPVVTTYPGSDINVPKVRILSMLSLILSKYNIFMSKRQIEKVFLFLSKKTSEIIRYGVDEKIFIEVDKDIARDKLGFSKEEKLVMFSGKFANPVKNAELAKNAVKILENVTLLEMTGGYTKEEMNLLYNAVDVALLTSHTEGSPQFIKETMMTGCPIVSVDVGDVAEVVEGLEGCYIAERNPQDIASKLQQALSLNSRTKGRERIIKLGLTNDLVAKRLVEIYEEVLKNN